MMHVLKKNILHIKHCHFAWLFCNIASYERYIVVKSNYSPVYPLDPVVCKATIKMMYHYYKLSSVCGWCRSCGGKWWKAMEKCEGGKRQRGSRKQVEKVSPAKRRRVNKLCVWHWTLSWFSLCWKSLQFQNCCLYSQTWVGQAAAGQP